MTCTEFSNEFDILYNNIMSNQAPGLDEYEKSVLLTTAQEMLVKSYYSGKNPFSDSFEKTEEVRRCLNELINTYTTETKVERGNIGLSSKSVFYSLPDNPKVWFITYESVILKDDRLECNGNNELEAIVIPTSQDDYMKIAENPFKRANRRKVLRLDNNEDIVELISEYSIKKYLIRYVTKPTPIILEDLEGGLSIDGISVQTECKLNPLLHRAILQKAVELASTLYK